MDKENFKIKAKNSIDEIFAKIDELEAKKDKAFDKAKAEYEETISELKVKKDELLAKYKKLTDDSGENWEEVKETFSSAAESFKEGFSKIGSLFRKEKEETVVSPSAPQGNTTDTKPENKPTDTNV